MREDWLAEIYQNIKQTRTSQISLAMSLLRKRAARDPVVAEAIRLLHPFASGQEQEEKPHADGIRPE
jgi:hypothetical protein